MSHRLVEGRTATIRLAGIAVAVVAASMVLAVGGLAPVVSAQEGGPPPTPAAYYGNVTIDGDPAPAGTEITAVIDGQQRGRLVTDSTGTFGGAGVGSEKLVVNGTNDDGGATVTFYVNGEQATPTVEWSARTVTQISLQVAQEDPDDGSGDGDGGDGSDSGDGGSGVGNDNSGDDGSAGSDGGSAGGGGGSGDGGGGVPTEPSDGSSAGATTTTTTAPATSHTATQDGTVASTRTQTVTDTAASGPTMEPTLAVDAEDPGAGSGSTAGSPEGSDTTSSVGPGFGAVAMLLATGLWIATARGLQQS